MHSNFRELMRDPHQPAKRLEALNKIGQILVPGYRISWPDGLVHNQAFNRYLQQFNEIEGYKHPSSLGNGSAASNDRFR